MPPRMWPFNPPTDRAPSALWLWGFWAYTGAAFVLSLYVPTPLDRFLRGIAGALLLVGGAHRQRVLEDKRSTRAINTALAGRTRTWCSGRPGGAQWFSAPCSSRARRWGCEPTRRHKLRFSGQCPAAVCAGFTLLCVFVMV
jgi:hypothetical protein